MDAALGPPEKMAERADELTPMMAQYFELCAAYDDALLLFQVGDFYEAFCEAAEVVARTCEITLTKREDSTGRYAMAGVPIDSAESYIERLLEAGYRVAVADQVEEPEEATGVVDRAVTRVLTPGTITETELLDGDRNNFVCALVSGDRHALSVLDVSTGDFYVTSAERVSTVTDELGRFDPAEAIIGPEASPEPLPEGCPTSPSEESTFALESAAETVKSYFGTPERLLRSDAEIQACGALLSYAEYTRGGEEGRLEYLNHLTRYEPREYMHLDAVALRSLELFERRAVQGTDDHTLVGMLDETASAPGRRRLEAWLRRPLVDRERIVDRHDAVGELRDDVRTREQLHERLRDVYDIERLISRIARRRGNARDLRALKASLDVVPELRDLLEDVACEQLRSLRDRLDPLEETGELVERAIRADPPPEITEGGLITPGYDDDLDRLRETEQDGKAWISALEAQERDRTGIESLKVGHNAVHGYYIEVTEANLDRVPEEYHRRQTLKNAERYYTPALKEREDELLRAAQLADELEYELFCDVREEVASESERVQELADALADLDALVSFATVAAKHDYSRPVVGHPPGVGRAGGNTEPVDGIHIEDGRHPVVERTQESFVPNGTALDSGQRLAVVTGPNMSGKSTYMRQVALIVILAQAGSFVPASAARLQLVDRVFTRVGASDDIAGGRSTFMIEMVELAEILDHATERSLVLLDEVGRGTSTADGLAIARAVAEFVHDELGSLALFATHHHALTAVADELECASNLSFRTHRDGHEVTFDHTVVSGAADASYGVEVAATAGVAPAVVSRARELLRKPTPGQTQERDERALDRVLQGESAGPVSPADPGESPGSNGASLSVSTAIERRIAETDVATLTPLDALNLLAELKRAVEDDNDR